MGDKGGNDGELTLRVMRRTLPLFETSAWDEGGMERAIAGPLARHSDKSSSTPASEQAMLALDDTEIIPSSGGENNPGSSTSPIACLHLPKAQGRVFAGENFCASLHLSNLTDWTFRRLTVQAELSISGSTPAAEPQRYVLIDTSSAPAATFPPSSHTTYSVEHPVAEAALHVLTCTVRYEVEGTGEPRLLRRTIRFNTESLFALSHRLRVVQDQVWVEVTVLNRSSDTFALLVSVNLDLLPALEAHLRSALSDQGKGQLVQRIGEEEDRASAEERGYAGVRFFKPGDAFKFLFRLNGTSEHHLAMLRSLPRLGHVALEWRTARGGAGSSKDYALAKTPLQPRGFDLRVISCPSTVRVHETFRLVVEVVNRTSKPVRPMLEIQSHPSHPIIIPGPNTLGFGTVEGYSSASLALDAISVSAGLHAIEGLCAVNASTQQTVEPEGVCEVLAF